MSNSRWDTPASMFRTPMSGISKRSARSVSASRSRPESRPISTLPPGHELAFASALPASPALLRKTPEAIASTAVDTNDMIVKLAELRSRRNEDEVQQRFEELEALRSRKPVFQRVRQLQESNKSLQALVAHQADRIAELEWRLAVEKQTNAALQAECETVRTATANMTQFVRQSEAAVGHLPAPQPLGVSAALSSSGPSGSAAETSEDKHSWIWKAVQRLFDMFDTNRDGLLDVNEMNSLQNALGNEQEYTEHAFKRLCKALSIPWRTSALTSSAISPEMADAGNSGGLVNSGRFESERASGGISADGLLAMYEHMGLDCLARDMKALGIPRDTAEQQLASVRHTVQHLTALEAKVKVKSNAAEQQLQELLQARQRDLEVQETLRVRLLQAEELVASATTANTNAQEELQSLRQQVFDLQGGMQEMARLLKEKVDEKHDLQRLLWHLEAKYASFTSILQQSQSIVWKEAQSKREQGRVTRLLHMKLKQKPGQTSDPASTLHDA